MSNLTKEETFLLLNIAEYTGLTRKPEKGHDPAMYVTGTYTGDMRIYSRLSEIKHKIKEVVNT